MNKLASNAEDSNVLRFPTYHVGHHRLNVDERSVFNSKLDLVMNSGSFRNGTFSEALAGALVRRTGYKFAIPTDSGTTALAIITAYVNSIRQLKTIVAPAVTYQATYNAIARALPNVVYDNPITEYEPCAFDVGPVYRYPENAVELRRSYVAGKDASSSYFRGCDAVVTVGLGGQHDSFNSPDVLVIEDCCQDWITKPYTGNHRAISFDPSKVVTGLTGGGAILTDSSELADFASRAISNGVQRTGASDICLSSVFGKHTITEIDALHVLIMLENVQKRLDARRVVMDLYKKAFNSALLYDGEQDHDMSKALLIINTPSTHGLDQINEKLKEQNLGQVRRLYKPFFNEGQIWSLPLSERFQVCPALEEMIESISEVCDSSLAFR